MIQIAQSENDLQKIFLLRYEVLRKPWGQPFESAFDVLDSQSLNAFIEHKNRCIACGRLDILNATTAQIRYMAVHPDYRGQGLGSQILTFLEQTARDRNIQKILLHARSNAVPFYQHHAYLLIRPSHILFHSIRHYLMEKTILNQKA